MVSRIEKIEGKRVVQVAEPDDNCKYHCYPEGQTMAKYSELFDNLDDVANYLIKNRRSRVRMNPDWSLIVDNIHIDGKPREQL